MSKKNKNARASSHAHDYRRSASFDEMQRRKDYDLGYNRAQMWIATEADVPTMKRVSEFMDRWNTGEYGDDCCINCAFLQAVAGTPYPIEQDKSDVAWMLGQTDHVDPHVIIGFLASVRDALAEIVTDMDSGLN